ncbi:heparinase II/III family protein [Myxococcota bacterium]|nr:heparinase II/III family protein [Myxococcota bacterium]
MSRHARLILSACLCLALVSSCDDGGAASGDAAAHIDAARAPLDMTPLDMITPDAITPDMAPPDAITPDMALPDAAPPDAIPPDMAPPDASPDSAGLDLDEDGLSWAEEIAAGTDPHLADTDGDGIEDGVELAEGTDPLEISSASAWHPARLAGRPRLYFGPEDRPALRARATGTAGAVILAQIQARAAQALPPAAAEYDRALSVRRAEIMEARAFLAFLDEDAAAATATAEALAGPEPDPGDVDPFSAYDLSEAEALIARCAAYDLIAGLAAPEIAEAAKAQTHLLVDRYAHLCLEGTMRPMVAFSRNNHAMKTQGALGLCALALNDTPRRVAELHEAITGLYHLLTEIQGDPSGAYAEGWNYLVYGGVSWLPLVLAYHRFARGAVFEYRALGRSVFPFPQAGQRLAVPDLVDDPTVALIFRRAVMALQPDGRTPPTDDANPVGLPGGLIAGLWGDPDLRWGWRAGEHASRLGVATLAVLDEARPPSPPTPLDVAFPDAGWASLRTDHDALAHQLLVLGERGGPRLHGFGHEHPDGASFQLFAYGSPLLIDPGYINWDNHALVNASEHHNILLVDGEGAPTPSILNVGADTDLSALSFGPGWASLTARTTHHGVDIERRFIRVALEHGPVYLIADRLDAATPHRYTALFQGAGFIDDGAFALTPHGGVWTPGPAEVEVASLTEPGPAALEIGEGQHQLGWGRWGPHTTLKVHAPEAASARLLTLILPRPSPAGPSPEVEIDEGSIRFGALQARLEPGGGLRVEIDGEAHRWP